MVLAMHLLVPSPFLIHFTQKYLAIIQTTIYSTFYIIYYISWSCHDQVSYCILHYDRIHQHCGC